MYRILLMFFIFILENGANAQPEFTLSGTLPEKFDGAELKLIFYGDEFAPLYTISNNGKFRFSGKINHEYEYVYLNISKGDISGSIGPFFIKNGDKDMSIEIPALPPDSNSIRYHNISFIDEVKKYRNLYKPIEDSVSMIFNLLSNVEDGFRNDYDVDTLSALLDRSRIEQRNRIITFIKSIISVRLN